MISISLFLKLINFPQFIYNHFYKIYFLLLGINAVMGIFWKSSFLALFQVVFIYA